MGQRNPALTKLLELMQDNQDKYTFTEYAELSGLTYDQVTSAYRRNKKKYDLQVKLERGETKKPTLSPRKARQEYIPPPPDTENVLVIGDIHEPFTLEGYREFCYETYKKYNITHVIFIGDVVDNHYASFHTPTPDGMGGGDELDLAIESIAEWVRLFPKADVILGNHDRIIMRKAFEGAVPRRWIMDYQDVLGAPGWNFTDRAVYDGIQYIHGEGGTARARCKKDLMSTVQGHLHQQAYTEHFVGANYHIFGMQVGCGVDRKSYAMAYAKNHPKPAIGVGVLLNHGATPFNLLMHL